MFASEMRNRIVCDMRCLDRPEHIQRTLHIYVGIAIATATAKQKKINVFVL